jgi:hypothetical protein
MRSGRSIRKAAAVVPATNRPSSSPNLPPPQNVGVVSGAPDSGEATVSWDANSSSENVTVYRVYGNSTEAGADLGASSQLTGLTSGSFHPRDRARGECRRARPAERGGERDGGVGGGLLEWGSARPRPPTSYSYSHSSSGGTLAPAPSPFSHSSPARAFSRTSRSRRTSAPVHRSPPQGLLLASRGRLRKMCGPPCPAAPLMSNSVPAAIP